MVSLSVFQIFCSKYWGTFSMKFEIVAITVFFGTLNCKGHSIKNYKINFNINFNIFNNISLSMMFLIIN